MGTDTPRRTGTLKNFSAVIFLGASTYGLPIGCGMWSPSDQGEPIASVVQADALAPIIPAAKPAVGYLPGTSAVSAAGGYEYTIPLDVPPGRAGMEPHLALRYASGAGVESTGAGWS